MVISGADATMGRDARAMHFGHTAAFISAAEAFSRDSRRGRARREVEVSSQALYPGET